MKDREEYISILEQDNAELKKQLEEYKYSHSCSFKKLQDKYKQLQQENEILKENQLLKKENKQLKEQLLVAQTNEETFRLEMEDITKILGLDKNTLFDDVKVCVKSLKEVSDD